MLSSFLEFEKLVIEFSRENWQICTLYSTKVKSFGLNVLDLLGFVKEVVGVSLGHETALVWLLDKVFVSLLLGESNGIFLGLKFDVSALHSVGGRLPTHERVLPAVTPLQDIPIHAPVVLVPGAGLCCGLSGAVDAVVKVST